MLGVWKDGKYYVEGLEYNFPDKPNNKTILNYGLPKRHQKWKRIDEYKEYDWGEGWEDRIKDEENANQLNYLVEEVDRLYNGVWVYINGEATYINRYMYFFLNWFVLEDSGDYPQYRDTSLYYYRFLEICIDTKLCTGHTLVKARRLGATSMIMAYFLLKLITTNNKKFGITSKTGEDANGAFGFVINAFQNLPVFLKPQMEGNTAPKKILSLKKQAERIKKDQKVTTVGSQGLNNQCYWRATGLNTFDSGAYEDILVDESGKFPSEVPISKYLPIVTKCVKKGARVTGKIHLPTTVNSPTKGGAEYRIVWNNSNQEKSDYLGQTNTGLYRIMIPAYCGYDGYVDEFGNSVIENPTKEQTDYLRSIGYCPDPNIGAKQYLEHIRKNLESNKEELQEEIRMNPFTADEVFESANERCLFDLDALNRREKELMDKLESMGRNPLTDELGRRGWFHKLPSGRVNFYDDPKGLWYIHSLLPESESNKFIIRGNGEKIPTNEEYGAAGLDPIQMGTATVDKGSDACLMIRNRYSSLNDENTGIPVAMFLGRMEDVTKSLEQMYNGLQYYGVKMLAERSPINWHTYAVDNKLLGYLYGTERANGSEVKGIVNQASDTVKQEHAECMVMASLHDIDKVPFIRLIRDRKEFSISNRTDYDAAMSDGFSLMAMKVPFKKAVQKVPEKPMIRQGKITTW